MPGYGQSSKHLRAHLLHGAAYTSLARTRAVIPGADLELIDGAGHLIHYDAPVQPAVALHRWLTSVR